MTSTQVISETWANALDIFEKANPQAFEFFYSFHSLYGIEEGDLSPLKRLDGIMEYSESAYIQIYEDLILSLLVAHSIQNQDNIECNIDDEHITLFSV
jgi:hypothetical protein